VTDFQKGQRVYVLSAPGQPFRKARVMKVSPTKDGERVVLNVLNYGEHVFDTAIHYAADNTFDRHPHFVMDDEVTPQTLLDMDSEISTKPSLTLDDIEKDPKSVIFVLKKKMLTWLRKDRRSLLQIVGISRDLVENMDAEMFMFDEDTPVGEIYSKMVNHIEAFPLSVIHDVYGVWRDRSKGGE
jgi:hypothetical protein